MNTEIDNAGGGNCGYYAMSIGLIKICKEHEAFIAKWFELDPNLRVSPDFFGTFDLQEMLNNPRRYEKANLDLLQASLRKIAYNAYQEHLVRESAIDQVRIRGTHLYNKFAELVNYYKQHATGSPNTDFNELAHSSQMLTLAKQNAKASEEQLLRVFLDNVDDIKAAAEKITDNGYWATVDELSAIAGSFDVNLLINQQIMGKPDELKPTIVLNNHRNAHWTTSIEGLNPSPQSALQTSCEVYHIVERTDLPIGMKRDLMEMIALYQTGKLAAEDSDDSDLKLAKQLQEEEFHLAGIKKS